MALPPEETNWDELSRRLVAFALGGLRARGLAATIQDAEDAVNDAIGLLYSPEHKDWDPSADTLERFLGSTINGLLQNRLRHACTRADADIVEVARAAHPRPASGVGDRLDAKAAVGELLERVSDDDLVFAVLVAMSDGIVEPRLLATELKVPVQRVYKARARIKKEADAGRRRHMEGQAR